MTVRTCPHGVPEHEVERYAACDACDYIIYQVGKGRKFRDFRNRPGDLYDWESEQCV